VDDFIKVAGLQRINLLKEAQAEMLRAISSDGAGG
jgi:hypothetical protein